MQYLLLLFVLALTLQACRCIRREKRLYRRTAWAMGLLVAVSMLVQELLLLHSGLLTWATGLPLHLCSLLGTLTLPMLLTSHPFLRSAALLLGMPGALLALIFPAIQPTSWPRLTALAFHTLHTGLFCAPLLPLAAGWRPRPTDALLAGLFLLLAGTAAMLVNPLTGGNYLFLAGPIAGTPLARLAQWGVWPYRVLLALLASLLLTAEALLLTVIPSEKPLRRSAKRET